MLYAFSFVIAAALAAYCFSFLTISGMAASMVVGLLSAWGLGFRGILVMGFFFISSSLLSKVKDNNDRSNTAKTILEKGSTRDWKQVLANGGLAAALGACAAVSGNEIWIVAYCISLASATSDTWASEIGPMGKGDPVSLGGLQRVPSGTSGAVSLIGTVASFAGAVCIAILAACIFKLNAFAVIIIVIFGFAGSLIDTIIGAYWQSLYQCEICGIRTEKAVHCGRRTKLSKGKPWLDNDGVNFLSGFIAVVLGIMIMKVI